ncbi:MAG: isopentenyl phosphate kinase [Gemmatimonadota bacterium]
MREAILLKLGGSLITEKDRPDTARVEVIARLAGEIADVWPTMEEGLVLGHGSGSFGHEAAQRYRIVEEGISTPDRAVGASRTQAKAMRLHGIVTEALREAGVPVFSLSPGSAAVSSSARPVSFHVEPVALALSRGLLPVTYGDVVLDRERGAAILSTEVVLRELAGALPAHGWRVGRVIWLGETDGIYDARGETIPSVSAANAASVRTLVGASASTDVTGGMAHRLDAALWLSGQGIVSWIGDGREPGVLARALRGQETGGTRVAPAAG